MFIIDMTQFRAGRSESEAQEAMRRLLFPYLQPAEDKPHVHHYGIVLMDQDNESGVELTAFEAPCPNGNAAGHVRALVHTLRELADEVESAHADLLAEDAEPADVPAHVLTDLLGLVGISVTENRAGSWSLTQRREAADWASAVHLSASDNDVEVPERPQFLTFTGVCAKHGAWTSQHAEMCPQSYHGPDLGEPCNHWPDGQPLDGCQYCKVYSDATDEG